MKEKKQVMEGPEYNASEYSEVTLLYLHCLNTFRIHFNFFSCLCGVSLYLLLYFSPFTYIS